ncbi:MAG: mechanosensitive ion channel [Candidatus Marinimicrobia bacterium]|nr:mechanosensitive ion channel [Candidatus Neomarinimicrobiota bacterium]MCF7840504.1 mechanosensitive ion channel [Candidatus Neomarinimicrobiota bacterium]
MFAEILNQLSAWWQIEIISNEILTLKLGNLILGLVIFLLGWKIGQFLIRKSLKRFLQNKISDTDTGSWLSKFILFLWFLVVLVTSLVILGIPASIFSFLWHLSLFTLEGHSVELGNVLLGLILLYPGIRFSRYLSMEFQSIFLDRLSLEPSSQNLLTVLVRYILIVFVALFVLTMVGIPLTAFTVIGGALAIGVGLGSQNLVNNFLSGLVLMIERPLKINDVVEVEGKRGIVEHIGGRSTRIRTSDNLRLVMPNSKLLENTVINWSLIDNQIRREVSVGVAYGSDVEKTAELIKQAMLEHPRVEKYPDPIVLFEEFGDNALNFRGIFWTDFDRAIRPRITASEIRFKINALFEEAGIVVAFPQRDVHLDSTKPVDVRVVNPGEDV